MSSRTTLVDSEKKLKIRINTVIKGEPAKWLREWKKRGIVTINTDAIVQSFRIFHEKIVEQDLKRLQLRALESRASDEF